MLLDFGTFKGQIAPDPLVASYCYHLKDLHGYPLPSFIARMLYIVLKDMIRVYLASLPMK